MQYTITPAYKHLTQKGDFCSATCMQMIFLRHGLRIDQEWLAYNLWVVIKEKDVDRFSLPFPIAEKSKQNAGLRIKHFAGERIRVYLEALWYDARVIMYEEMTLDECEQHFITSIQSNTDCMIGFYRWPLDPSKTRWHYVLLAWYDTDTRLVTVCDPTPKTQDYRTISIQQLRECMSDKRDRARGIGIIKKR